MEKKKKELSAVAKIQNVWWGSRTLQCSIGWMPASSGEKKKPMYLIRTN